MPSLLPRSEYGLEIAVVLAFLVYCIGISQDQARSLPGFFCHLELSKSQAHALLNHLGKLWKRELEVLSELPALATVVCLDETGPKVSARRKARLTRNAPAWLPRLASRLLAMR